MSQKAKCVSQIANQATLQTGMSDKNALTGRKTPGDIMPIVKFLEFDGSEHEIEVSVGTSVMRAAVDNGVPGIDGDCDGQCACATCHIYVDSAWLPQTGERTLTEEELLSFASATEPNSRLACQIKMTNALDGLVVRMPASQH